jgi:hypothetical protein
MCRGDPAGHCVSPNNSICCPEKRPFFLLPPCPQGDDRISTPVILNVKFGWNCLSLWETKATTPAFGYTVEPQGHPSRVSPSPLHSPPWIPPSPMPFLALDFSSPKRARGCPSVVSRVDQQSRLSSPYGDDGLCRQ